MIVPVVPHVSSTLTCADRLYRWRRDGTWDRLLMHAQTRSDAIGEVVWEVSVDRDSQGLDQIGSLPTKGIDTCAVVGCCGCGRSRT
jgi:hypothetical protein